MPSQQRALDANVLIALIDDRDKFHLRASELAQAIHNQQTALVYFDCVVTETISALCRRAHEQKRASTLTALLTALEQQLPVDGILWISRDLPRFYAAAVELVIQTNGVLNFNDALITIVCRELGITAIASFDQDFDLIPWLKRIARPEDLQAA
jgi:predicted nucleic acid-binding protein